MHSTELRIEPPDANVTNEYRINRGILELRVRDRTACYYPPQGTDWRALTEGEVNAHIALNTVVSQWMSSKRWQPARN